MNAPTVGDLMEAIAAIKVQVERIADAMQKQQDRKEYQAEYYKKRKRTAAEKRTVARTRLNNGNQHCLGEGKRDKRLPHAAWARKLKEMAGRGLSAYNFLTWLAWAWNHNCFEHVPFTRSGGYYQVYIGTSGEKALRSRYSERDVTGHVRVYTFKTHAQLDTYKDALFWRWSYAVLSPVVWDLDGEPWYDGLGDSWKKPFKIAQGGFGGYEVSDGVEFDPTERDLKIASKTYAKVRPTLEMCWGSWLRGLNSKEEPFKSK